VYVYKIISRQRNKFIETGGKGKLPPSKIPASNVKEEIYAYMYMLETKRNADAIHHRGLTGCDVDPGPQGIGIVRNIMSIGYIQYVYSAFRPLVTGLSMCIVARSKSAEVSAVQGALSTAGKNWHRKIFVLQATVQHIG